MGHVGSFLHSCGSRPVADPQYTRTLQKRTGSTVGLAVGVTLGVLILLCGGSLIALWLYLRRKGSRLDGDRTIYKPVAAADLDLDDEPVPMALYNMPHANGSFNPYEGDNLMISAGLCFGKGQQGYSPQRTPYQLATKVQPLGQDVQL